MDHQKLFLETCKESAKSSNFARDLAELLGVNTDAAYRRMRGTTALTFSEIEKICSHYKVSFDSTIGYRGRTSPFQFNSMFKDDFQILEYLKEINSSLLALAHEPDSRLTMTAMDLPYFRQFGFKSLRRFKMFYWQRSVLNLEAFKHLKFDALAFKEEYEAISDEIFINYHKVDSTEIWAPETVDSTIKQVQYYLESGLFESKESALSICQDMFSLLAKLEREALLAKKVFSTKEETYTSKFAMYQSDILLSNNSVQGFTNDRVYTYVSFNSFNSLMSYAPPFSEECSAWIKQIRLKSILLSEVSEKLRYQFFQSLRSRITSLIKQINKSNDLPPIS